MLNSSLGFDAMISCIHAGRYWHGKTGLGIDPALAIFCFPAAKW